MIDTVFYDIGYGFMGRIANRLFVRREIERIFRYRELQIRRELALYVE
jgi:hypothetical protein